MTSVRSVVHPGWVEVTAPGVHAVVAAADRHAESLAEAARGGLFGLLEALTAHGLGGAPDLAAVAVSDAGVRVVVRGTGSVVLADGTRLRAEGRQPWRDLDVDAATAGEEVTVAAPDPESPRGWRRPGRLAAPVDPPLVSTEPFALPEVTQDDVVVADDGADPGGDPAEPDVPDDVADADDGADQGGDPAAPVEPDDDRAMVLAVLCPAGHPSPPDAGACRTCGQEIPPQQPTLAPRPVLGVLRVSTGGAVPLDRGVLMGRAPRVNVEFPPLQGPHLLVVGGAERDISRNHAEVVLEGWEVLVRDLGSTNGTTVTHPGQETVRLRPGEGHPIEPGAVLALADEVSLTYEVEG